MDIEHKTQFILITDIVNGYLFKRKYIFYTEKEAIEKFKQEVKEESENGKIGN